MSRKGLQPEQKNIDFQGQTLTGPATNAFSDIGQSFSAIAVGAGPNARVGRKIHMKSIQIRGIANSAVCRIVVVYDKQFNKGAGPIFGAGGAAQVMSPNIFSGYRNAGNIDRFITILDEIVSPHDGTYTAPATGSTPNYFSFYRKLNLEAVYDGDLATDCVTGAILITQADTDQAISTVVMTTRIRFTDV